MTRDSSSPIYSAKFRRKSRSRVQSRMSRIWTTSVYSGHRPP